MAAESGKATAVRAKSYLVELGEGYVEIAGTAKKALCEMVNRNDRLLALGKKRGLANIDAGGFDMVKFPKQLAVRRLSRRSQLDNEDIRQHLSRVRLVEVKSSNRADVRSGRGNKIDNWFFSLSYPEQLAAQLLGDRFVFAFVCLPRNRTRAWHKLLTWKDIWSNAKKVFLGWSIHF